MLKISSPLVLASKSPRRKKILQDLNLNFIIKPQDIEENINNNISPQENAKFLSIKKGEAASTIYKNDWIIACDTLVEIKGRILGKPRTRIQAIECLNMLSEEKHNVFGAITLINRSKLFKETVVSKTEIHLSYMPPSFIINYVDTFQPYDKAGGYGIQEPIGLFTRKILGSLSNVIGLDVPMLLRLFKKANLLEK